MLDLEANEMLHPDQRPYAFVEIHSPFESAPYVKKGLILEPRRAYTIIINLEEHHFLPSPYATDCRDYEYDWEKNNKTGPRSELEYRRNCNDINNRACWNCNFDDTEKLNYKCYYGKFVARLCNDTELQKYSKIREICESQFKKECIKRIYHLTLRDIPDYSNKNPNVIGVRFQVNEPVVYIYEHRPQYAPVEFYSTVGGFLGCWLGISAWSSMNFLLNIPSSLRKKLTKKIFIPTTFREL